MSLSDAALAARADISRSQRVLFDTAALTYQAGLFQPTPIDRSAAFELIQANALQMKRVLEDGTVIYRLSDDATKEAVQDRKRADHSNRRPLWSIVHTIHSRGPQREPDTRSLTDFELAAVVSFTPGLFEKFVRGLLDIFEKAAPAPTCVGATLSLPGYVMPTWLAAHGGVDPLTHGHLFEHVQVDAFINLLDAGLTLSVSSDRWHLTGRHAHLDELLIKAQEPLEPLLKRKAQDVLYRVQDLALAASHDPDSTHPDFVPPDQDPYVIPNPTDDRSADDA